MEKYDAWNDVKKLLSRSNTKALFKEGEIWWMSLGVNLGEEMYGKGRKYARPALVLKKLSPTSCVILPLSTKAKKGSWFFSLTLFGKTQTISLHQVRFVSTKRFVNKFAKVKERDFDEIKKSVRKLYGF